MEFTTEFIEYLIAQAPTFLGLVVAIGIQQIQLNRQWKKIDEQDRIINQMRAQNGQDQNR